MTERFIVDDAGTLIDIKTRNTYDIVEEVVDLLNEQDERIKELENKLEHSVDEAEERIRRRNEENAIRWINIGR